ncbi:MAG: hypothetical protein HYZ34_15535 [Ignavibacteriae bacterium]|nr:hypothetical protein [Ignavibacteriota bacterium]
MKNLIIIFFLAVVFIGFTTVINAQTAAVTSITVNAAATPLAVTNSDGGVDDVLRATAYTVVYDAYAAISVVKPNNNGEVTNGDIGCDITGDPFSNVVVEMDLPDVLDGIGGTTLAITFPANGPGSGVVGETGGFFNPNVSNTFNLGAGLTTLRLGYSFIVPAEITIAGEIFVGQILTNTYYTGL